MTAFTDINVVSATLFWARAEILFQRHSFANLCHVPPATNTCELSPKCKNLLLILVQNVYSQDFIFKTLGRNEEEEF